MKELLYCDEPKTLKKNSLFNFILKIEVSYITPKCS